MRPYKATSLVAAVLAGFFASQARAQEFIAHLTGFNEVGVIPTAYTGAILSNGKADVTLDVDRNASKINYTLSYQNVGTTPPLTGNVTQAHIHFGKPHTSGGVLVFLCSNLNNAPQGTPACSDNSDTISGTWTSASVAAIPGQNVPAMDFDALVQAIITGTAYANIHTTVLPAGELRGQIMSSDRRRYLPIPD